MTQPTPPSASSRWERILTISLIVIGLLLVGFFGLRAARSYIRIYQTGLQPGVTNVEAIRGWMTVPYIATAYGVPEEYIFEQIGVPQEGNQDKSLWELNRDYFGNERAAILKPVQEAIKQYQAEHPPTPEAPHD